MSRIEVNGVTLSVTELPQRLRRRAAQRPGTPIVMLHGLAASSAFWYAAGAPILTVLGPCLLYDLRGHGKSGTPPTGYGVGSMAHDLEALLDARGYDRVHLVAHSFGGMVALAYTLRHPERVESLMLVDVRVRQIQKKLTIPVQSVPLAVERQLLELGLDISKISQSDDGVDYLRTVAKIEVDAGDEAADLLSAIYRHPRLFRSRRNAERWIDLTERVSLIADLQEEPAFGAADLAKLDMPMMIMVGGQSNTLPSAREMVRLCPHAIFHEVPDVGHFFPMSQPRLFLRPALRFLNAVNRGRMPINGRAVMERPGALPPGPRDT
jgi:pimeloyl-ACP methyl ester carboxylesterase